MQHVGRPAETTTRLFLHIHEVAPLVPTEFRERAPPVRPTTQQAATATDPLASATAPRRALPPDPSGPNVAPVTMPNPLTVITPVTLTALVATYDRVTMSPAPVITSALVIMLSVPVSPGRIQAG